MAVIEDMFKSLSNQEVIDLFYDIKEAEETGDRPKLLAPYINHVSDAFDLPGFVAVDQTKKLLYENIAKRFELIYKR